MTFETGAGYAQNRREENGIDPNRDFAWDQVTYHSMLTCLMIVTYHRPLTLQSTRIATSRHHHRSATVEQIWHIYDSQGQILTLTFRLHSLKPFMQFSFRSEANQTWSRGTRSVTSLLMTGCWLINDEMMRSEPIAMDKIFARIV